MGRAAYTESSRLPDMLFGLILLVLIGAACILFVLKPAWFPLAITAEAVSWDRQFERTLIICAVIFIAVQILLAWIILRGRKRAVSTGTSGHRGLELGWTAAAAMLFLGLAFTGPRGWAKIPKQTPGEEVIKVDAHQFAWSFHYAGADGIFGRTDIKLISDAAGNSIGLDANDPAAKDDIVAATLRIPAGRDVLLLLRSRDVIHDFFVPELRTKQDIVPGMEIPLAIHVDRPGSYEIACAELCGLGHSQMRSMLIALPAAEYEQWKRERH